MQIAPRRELIAMHHLLDRPRVLGLLCAAGAVGLGLAYMAAAGAPPRYLLVNLAALILGAALWLALGSAALSRLAPDGKAVLALTLPLIATAIAGASAEGASRWVFLGPLSVQVSLVVLPAAIVLYARSTDVIGTVAMALAACALAAQPDRAMAAVLAAGMAAVLIAKPGRLPALALAAAAAGFAVAMLQPDALPAVPFVDRILYTAFGVHAAAGAGVLAGCVLLLAPAFAGGRGMAERPSVCAFGACWAAVIVAAALGNYPTPLVGYGGSAVLGYLLAVALLPAATGVGGTARSGAASPQADRRSGGNSAELSALRQG
jgi:cell division protein FtsW (lipid II flippase)